MSSNEIHPSKACDAIALSVSVILLSIIVGIVDAVATLIGSQWP